jgi:8-oxo-dGTP pyrophosphatase MutT (NUDIX family)
VLLLLYPKNKIWHVALIERIINENDVHSGQLSFPGGRFDENDYSYQDCALREAEEEIGVPASSIGIIGELTSLYVPVSNFLIFPFVGFMSDYDDFNIQKSEVSKLYEVPLKHIIDQKTKKKGDIKVRNRTLTNVPYYDIEGKKLWGATAMIMSEFEQILHKTIM